MFKVLSFCFLCFSFNAFGQTVMVLGDSLSAGYQMPIERSWPTLMAQRLKASGQAEKVIYASISGDTTGNGLARLPALLDAHQPDWVVIELGANDGLRGWSPDLIRKNLALLIKLSQQSGAQVALIQIQIPPNYGKRYSKAFSDIYPEISAAQNIPLIPFFMEKVVLPPGWLMSDELHPTEAAQPYIADFVLQQLTPYLSASKT